MSTLALPSSPNAAAAPPPAVSVLVRTLCLPWMLFKRNALRPRLSRAVFERVGRHQFVVWPGVFNPVVFRTGRFLAEFVARTKLLADRDTASGCTALDIGTGCGILAVFAAVRGYAVTAVDVEERAVSCARANAILNGLEDRIDVMQGDLFEPVAGRQFDAILVSLPKFRGDPTTPFERAWKSPNVIDRFAARLPSALKPDGIALFVLTSHGDSNGMLEGLHRSGLSVERLTWKHFGVETMAIYAARRRAGVPSGD